MLPCHVSKSDLLLLLRYRYEKHQVRQVETTGRVRVTALCKWCGSREQALAWTKQEFEWVRTPVTLVAHWVRLSKKLKASLAKSHPLVLFFSLTHLCCSLFILKAGQIFFLFSNSVWIQHNLFPKMRKTIL